ncbi:hypothetical protein BUALT_Bualt18G0036300 [Buddleja alternifolia]|uniref:BAH domain-containing protein n=1 Tax=Buddleja alternifolia TaxID=168488 RepID=A0AAV6W3B2_9LAMI|nr:hypothetical protein BUALT_Bualt18G0036300 [Buddleja alternifolia]
MVLRSYSCQITMTFKVLTIEGICTIHTFKNYTKLEHVGPEDYYCRFEYKTASGAFLPDRVAVYCKREMPYNLDDLMIQCDECKDWYMNCFQSAVSFSLNCGQVPDASNSHGPHIHRFNDSPDPPSFEVQIGTRVHLFCHRIPKSIVAQGVVVDLIGGEKKDGYTFVKVMEI